MTGGGRFDFDDGGTYCGGWEDGKAHGHGVCTGPKGQGEYSGAWHSGFEISGVYTWPSGNSFEGTWTQGKRHGLGIETKGRWVYRGEWTQGFKGRYGVRESTNSGAKYEGTWTTGMQDGYGVESYADGGMYQGQWLRGMRHGYGVRQSVPYGLASHYRSKALRTSLTSLRSEAEEDRIVKERDRKIDESRGGFVLKARGDESPSARRRSLFNKKGRSSLRKALTLGLKLRKQKSTGDIQESPTRRLTGGSVRSTISNISRVSADSSQSALTNASVCTDGSNLSFVSQDDINDPSVTETYTGEWKNDKRSGFGISERSDGLRYEGEWYNNKKYGYGVTTHKDGTKEDGKYKNNVLIASGKKTRLFLIRSSKLREQIDNAVVTAQRASQIALQKADIAVSRMANARNKSELAERAADKAKQDSDIARLKAKEYAPEFHQPGTDMMRKRLQENDGHADTSHLTPMANHNPHQRSRSMTEHGGPNRSGPEPEQDTRSALTMAPMDCAIAGSSSRLVGQLYDMDRSSQNQNQTQSRLTPNNVGLRGSSSRLDGGGLGLGRAGVGGYGYGYVEEPTQRFSELLNSTVVSDHFDQYGNLKEDTIGRDVRYRDTRPAGGATNYDTCDDDRHSDANPDGVPLSPDSLQPPPCISTTLPSSAAGGDGDTKNEEECSVTRPLTRRKTLPSMVRRSASFKCIAALPEETTTSQRHLNSHSGGDTYIVENGIRKRVKAEVYSQPPRPESTSSSESIDQLQELPKRYRMEKVSVPSSKGPRGSLPDVSQCAELQKHVMPRDEISKLSAKRREELRLMREQERLRKDREIVLSLADLKDWCQQRQLLMLVLAINVSLATVFFNILQ